MNKYHTDDRTAASVKAKQPCGVTRKVTLRYDLISKGELRSYYLDIYPPVRDPDTLKLKRHHYLGIYTYDKPKDESQRLYNREMLTRVNAIRDMRAISVVNEQYGFMDKGRLQRDFLAYFRELAEKNGPNWKSAYYHFYHFTNGRCLVGEVDRALCQKYRDWIVTAPSIRNPNKTLGCNTAAGYFATFKKMLWVAHSQGILAENVGMYVDWIDVKPTRREFLTQEEVFRLSATPCDIEVLKRASLFSIGTGLRKSDVLALEWSQIVPGILSGHMARIRMEKTDEEIDVPLNDELMTLCGERGRGRVFEGLQPYMTDKPLKKWLHEAGIDKRVSFHGFRHTYAVLQLASGTDIYTVSRMLGHKHVQTTEIYAHIVEECRMKALDRVRLFRPHPQSEPKSKRA